MGRLRILIRDHRGLAMLFFAAALLVKAVVPAGYMLGTGERFMTVQLCTDGLSHETLQIAIPMGDRNAPHHSGKPDSPCPFAGLSMGSLAAADAPLLAMALAFILLLGFAPARTVPRPASPHLRPPLRGPPAVA